MTRRPCGCEYDDARGRVVRYCLDHAPAPRLANRRIGDWSHRLENERPARARDAPPRAKPRQRERAEQAQIVHLLESVGARVWQLGTTRAKRCHKCGEFSRDMSTRQSPGLADVYAVLPAPPRAGVGRNVTVADVRSATGLYAPVDMYVRGDRPCAVWIEAKRPKTDTSRAGRASDAQLDFQSANVAAGVVSLVANLDDVVAFLVAGGWLKPDAVRART